VSPQALAARQTTGKRKKEAASKVFFLRQPLFAKVFIRLISEQTNCQSSVG